MSADNKMTKAQYLTLRRLCDRYDVAFDPAHYSPQFDLPTGWVAGWVGGADAWDSEQGPCHTIYVGVSPEGDAHS